ncbi:MAG: hypothetical protein ACI9UA_006285 [Pseudoalteromonas tetraodonis]|jgi:hypothetical protein
MRRTLQILMIFIVACSSSSHLGVLQVVAWTGMIVENVQQGDLDEALSKTFDGDHPCGLCHAIEGAAQDLGDEDERAPAPNVQILDLKLLPLDRVALSPPVPVRLGMVRDDVFSVTRAFSPAVPPPRLA